MRLVGRNRLAPLQTEDLVVARWTTNWMAEVASAHWVSADDISDQFPNSSQELENIFVFPVITYRWSIALLVSFPDQIALVTDLRAA